MFSDKNSYWLKSGIYSILEKGGNQILGFGTVFILFRQLSVDEMGIWAYFLIITSFLELARNGLIQNGLIKYLASTDKESYPRIVTASLFLNVVLTAICIILLFILAAPISTFLHTPILEKMLHFYIITTIILLPFYHVQFLEQANLSFKSVFYTTFLRQFIFFISVIVIFLFQINIDPVDLVILQILSILPATVLGLVLGKSHIRLIKSIDFYWVKQLFGYGKYVFGTNISGVLFHTADQMILGNLLNSNRIVGLYNSAIRISNLVDVPISSIAAVVFPQGARRMEIEGRGALKNLYEKSVGLILAIILPVSISVLIFPKFFLLLMAGKKYLEASAILQVTIFYTLISPFTRLFGTIIDSMGRPKLNFYFILCGALLNIFLNIIFIKSFGTLGAAFGTLVTYVAMLLFTQVVLSNMFQVSTLGILNYMINYYKEGFNLALGTIKRLYGRRASN